ncbi:hypothetical protein BN190_2420044 [Clostridioides difficile T14]|nr:hypothetical protein BN171_2140023 [Clostridioides difficile E25]CCL22128.1 hypothetical protein BN172_2880002 [Clostridioides difficile T15]CCL60915.1 hypothetical protein BN182_1750057 [Clostridioides difficile E9]CCL80061.1 hypothetical protein BN187_1860039 [Clostridioides difficile E12]CCL91369.1 hypothetical protein BN190_2420044 [Clostridioides difficile T14]
MYFGTNIFSISLASGFKTSLSTSNMVFSPKVTCPLDLSTFTGIPLFLKVSSTEALTFLAKSCSTEPEILSELNKIRITTINTVDNKSVNVGQKLLFSNSLLTVLLYLLFI